MFEGSFNRLLKEFFVKLVFAYMFIELYLLFTKFLMIWGDTFSLAFAFYLLLIVISLMILRILYGMFGMPSSDD